MDVVELGRGPKLPGFLCVVADELDIGWCVLGLDLA